MTTQTLSASTLTGDPIKNVQGEKLGTVEEIMIDLESGRVVYLVMASGGVLGMGEAYFAVPWDMVEVDTEDHAVIVDIDKETIENAPGFDKDNWPDATELSRLSHY
jgi:sporulation protein YlmC with PRC-barrel domain